MSLIMGRKAYSSHDDPGHMSRIEKDLSSSTPNPMVNQLSGEMFRRVLPKGRAPNICVVGAGMSG